MIKLKDIILEDGNGAPAVSGGGLTLPSGLINAAPKSKDVKKMRKILGNKKTIKETYEMESRRVSTARLSVLMEKICPLLSTSQLKEVTTLLAKLSEGVTKVNEMPYGIFTYEQFANTFKEQVTDVATNLVEVLNKVLSKPSKNIDMHEVQIAINTLTELYILQ